MRSLFFLVLKHWVDAKFLLCLVLLMLTMFLLFMEICNFHLVGLQLTSELLGQYRFFFSEVVWHFSTLFKFWNLLILWGSWLKWWFQTRFNYFTKLCTHISIFNSLINIIQICEYIPMDNAALVKRCTTVVHPLIKKKKKPHNLIQIWKKC